MALWNKARRFYEVPLIVFKGRSLKETCQLEVEMTRSGSEVASVITTIRDYSKFLHLDLSSVAEQRES